MLSAIPTQLESLNTGLSTLQFQSVSINPTNANDIQGGTQDNGTWESDLADGPAESVGGDGGNSYIDPANTDIRMHTYYNPQVDVNFRGSDPTGWDWVADPLLGSGEASSFYIPVEGDRTAPGTVYTGLQHVWRTTDNGGDRATLDQHCNEFTGDFTVQCGDWVPLDGATLTSSSRGTRSGGAIGWISRTTSDSSTLWAATTTGRVFISKNADAEPASAVTFTRLDTLAANSPGRAVSSISIDPANPNHAYISYLSYSAITPATPGHVFSVTYDPIAGTATWVDLEGTGTPIGDQPVNGVAYDNVAGDLYASTDFGVIKLAGANPANGWTLAAQGLPVVTVAGLTINPGARQLLAATHGRGAYQLTLP
jgi:hypothetical protein